MTWKEFEALRLDIQQQRFVLQNEADPISFAMQRATFRKAQLQRLINLARQVKDSATVAARIGRWERQITRLDQTHRHFGRYRNNVS